VAYFSDLSPTLQIYLRSLLRKGSNIQTALWLAVEKQLRGCELDSEVEETRLWKALLPALHPDQGNQLQRNVYLPRAQGTAQGRPNGSMRKLRMSRMFKLGLAGSFLGVLRTRERWRNLIISSRSGVSRVHHHHHHLRLYGLWNHSHYYSSFYDTFKRDPCLLRLFLEFGVVSDLWNQGNCHFWYLHFFPVYFLDRNGVVHVLRRRAFLKLYETRTVHKYYYQEEQTTIDSTT